MAELGPAQPQLVQILLIDKEGSSYDISTFELSLHEPFKPLQKVNDVTLNHQDYRPKNELFLFVKILD